MAYALSTMRRSAPPPPRRGGGGDVRSVIRGFGELMITFGLVVLLFVFYALYVTNWLSGEKQREAADQLEQAWQNPRGVAHRPIEGEGIARLYIPAFGPDYVYTVLEGTTDEILEAGPGRYVDTALPGEPGNFAVAGHRVGKGAPFNDLDLLSSCDAIVVETMDQWFVYRVLPLPGEAAGWEFGKGAAPRCAGVTPLPDPYSDVVGKHIVLPSQAEVIAAVPGSPDVVAPPAEAASLITLTTCHPQFSARERLIVHGVLVASYPKVPGEIPPELTTATTV